MSGGICALPLYAYRCTQCGHKFEKIQNFSADQETECPQCHGLLERPLTAPRLHFKGAGWYINDYAPKSGEAASDAAPADTKAPAAKNESSTPAADSTPAAAPAATPSSNSPTRNKNTTVAASSPPAQAQASPRLSCLASSSPSPPRVRKKPLTARHALSVP